MITAVAVAIFAGVVAVVVDVVVTDAMSFVVVIVVIAVCDAVGFIFAFALVIDAGVGVDVVCVLELLILDLTKHRKIAFLPAKKTPKFCSQNYPCMKCSHCDPLRPLAASRDWNALRCGKACSWSFQKRRLKAGHHWQTTNSQNESLTILQRTNGRGTSLPLRLRQPPLAIGRLHHLSETGCQRPILPCEFGVQEKLRRRLFGSQMAFSAAYCIRRLNTLSLRNNF